MAIQIRYDTEAWYAISMEDAMDWARYSYDTGESIDDINASLRGLVVSDNLLMEMPSVSDNLL